MSNTRPYRIAQLSDIHLGNEAYSMFGANPRDSFIKTLNYLINQNIDEIVLSGDICLDEGVLETYIWCKQQLDSLGIPYSIIPGNHDSIEMIVDVFEMQSYLQKNEIYYSKIIQKIPCLFLDSSTRKLSAAQLHFIEQNIHPGTNIIFIHHPICYVGVPYMDTKHSFQSIKEINELLLSYTDCHFKVFCGHYHVDRFIKYQNIDIQIAPSSYFSINPFVNKIDLSSGICSFRLISLSSGSAECHLVSLP